MLGVLIILVGVGEEVERNRASSPRRPSNIASACVCCAGSSASCCSCCSRLPDQAGGDEAMLRRAMVIVGQSMERRRWWGSGLPAMAKDIAIHSTAVVDPHAVLGEGVSIGPFCTVGGGARLGKGCILHPASHVGGSTELGDSCVVHTGAVVGADIPGHTVIGRENTIGHHAVIGARCQDLKYKDQDDCFLVIGDYNDIREFVSIHRSSKWDNQTVIGNGNLIMGSCHIAHDCKLGNKNILANGTLLGGHVVIKDFVHTGGAVAVHQFCHIDSYSFLAGGSMVVQDVPMYMMVAGDRARLRGLNLEGLRRCGFSDSEMKSMRKAYQKLFMNTDPDVGLEERLKLLESIEELIKVPSVSMMLESIRNCFGENRRGVCTLGY